MKSTHPEPFAYLKERIRILETQLSQIDEEIRSRSEDHDRIMTELNGEKWRYIGALTQEEKLRELSRGKDFDERRQNMYEIIRAVNSKIYEELRAYKEFLKSLKSEKRRIEREVQELRLRFHVLKELPNGC